jgi:AmmeMemoRadiSam system protein A
VGGGNLARAKATAKAMDLVARHALASNPDTLVLISPHSPRHPGAFGFWHTPRLRGSFVRFGSPGDKVDLPLDRIFTERLEQEARRRVLRTWRIEDDEPLDHGALVPLWYLCAVGWNRPTVILGLNYPGDGGLDELGQAIATTTRELNRRTALIASGDMSHRLTRNAPAGYDPDAPRFDATFVNLLRAGAYGSIGRLDPALQDKAAEDVVDSTQVALAAVSYQTTGHKVLSYEGPFGVGYGVAILFDQQNSGPARSAAAPRERKIVSRLSDLPAVARCAVEAKLRNGPAEPTFEVRGELAEPGALFVTVRSQAGELRGCRGVTAPVEPDLVEETWHCAVSAALLDSRFRPVTAEELPGLQFSVTVLGPLEPVATAAELNPAVYGVKVSSRDGRRGVLLPAIAGVDTVEEQLAVARQKAGITAEESVNIERFSARSFIEAPVGTEGGT